MKYITLHETTSEYNQVKDSLAKPQVAYISEINKVEYQPYVDPSGGHQYVEIGGKKWATMNVGASSVTDTGLYFQWGDTVGYTAAQVGVDKIFEWNGYKYTNDGGTTFTKYNDSDNIKTLEASDDAVTAAWGGSWRMPTAAEFAALGAAVNTAFTEVNGVSGLVCTDKTDETNTLFFPACGFAWGSQISNGMGKSARYFAKTLSQEWLNEANGFALDYGQPEWEYGAYRYMGCVVRGILDV